MTRVLFVVALLVAPSFAQVGIKIRWTCPKEGRFSVKHCEGCNTHYCMDGEHFHADEGPVPSWVFNYFAELQRRSEEIRKEIAQKGAELGAAHAANVERSKQLNAKYAAEHEAFMRRVQSGQHATARRMLTPGYRGNGVVEAAPETVVPPRLLSKAELESVKVGDNRAEVLVRLGTPSSAISIPGDEGTLETLSYRAAPDRTARINLRHGRVIEISLPQF